MTTGLKENLDCLLNTNSGISYWFLIFTTFKMKRENDESLNVFSMREYIDNSCEHGIPVGAFDSYIPPSRPNLCGEEKSALEITELNSHED